MIYSNLVPVNELNASQIDEMFGLYAKYYAGTSRILFESDLAEKNHVILLLDDAHHICGFSTVRQVSTEFEGLPFKILFSGDTIVEQCYWGKNNLAQEWLKYAGAIKSQTPEVPLYWLLIVKGHRTYRYLSAFSHDYYPAPGVETPLVKKRMMDQLSLLLFGEAYDADKGILHFAESRGHLKEEWASIPEKDLQRQEVQYFLQRNPGYRYGDELVCLCELTEANLKPLSRRIFSQP